ncbi:exo-beta-N-acetylmuramidase NamZ domain-containing protein [Trinickia dinghuensis]|nr:exo-beta-N-acetylmuramidase NamZ domain-containing protein [Trinickia dinghuensis]
MRVGLVTNRSGFDSVGTRTIDLIAHAPGVTLASIFAPEHGIDTSVDEPLADTHDAATGVVVHSLYGATRRVQSQSPRVTGARATGLPRTLPIPLAKRHAGMFSSGSRLGRP